MRTNYLHCPIYISGISYCTGECLGILPHAPPPSVTIIIMEINLAKKSNYTNNICQLVAYSCFLALERRACADFESETLHKLHKSSSSTLDLFGTLSNYSHNLQVEYNLPLIVWCQQRRRR